MPRILVIEDSDLQRKDIIELAKQVVPPESGIVVVGVPNTRQLEEQLKTHHDDLIIAASTDRNMWRKDKAMPHARLLNEAGVTNIAVFSDDDLADIRPDAEQMGVELIYKDTPDKLQAFFRRAVEKAVKRPAEVDPAVGRGVHAALTLLATQEGLENEHMDEQEVRDLVRGKLKGEVPDAELDRKFAHILNCAHGECTRIATDEMLAIDAERRR